MEAIRSLIRYSCGHGIVSLDARQAGARGLPAVDGLAGRSRITLEDFAIDLVDEFDTPMFLG